MSIVRGVDGDDGRRALASALVSFAQQMGMTIVAEGIETEGERDALRSIGVRYGQGYLLGRPAELPLAAGRAAAGL